MFRRFLFLSLGSLAFLAVLGAPGQLYAQHMRGGSAHGSMPRFHGSPSREFHHGVFGHPFGPGPRTFNHRFDHRFDTRFNRRFFDHRFNRGFFDHRFDHGFFDPRFRPMFRPQFFMPF
jgi:hypothetical protein